MYEYQIVDLKRKIKNCDDAIAAIDSSEPSNEALIDNWFNRRQQLVDMLDTVKASQSEAKAESISDMPHGGPGRQDWPPPSNR